jgi:hypothetical protein
MSSRVFADERHFAASEPGIIKPIVYTGKMSRQWVEDCV